MWKPLSIVSSVALLAAGGIEYSQVRPLLTAERIQLDNAKDYQAKAEKTKLDGEAAFKTAEKELEKAKDGLSKAEREKAEAAAKKEEVVKALEEAVAAKEVAAKDLAEQEAKMKDLGGIEAMVAELKAQEAKRTEYDKQIATAQAAITTALASKGALDKQIADIKRIDLWQQTGTMAPTFRSRVTAVNPEWGFVTIGAGNSAAVTRQAKLDVVRGKSVIGQLVVTHVSPASASAEIIPGSVAPGDSILPGDVVKTGSASLPSNIRVAPTPAAPKASDTAVPAPDAAPAADPFAAPAAPADAPAAPAAETPVEPAATPMAE